VQRRLHTWCILVFLAGLLLGVGVNAGAQEGGAGEDVWTAPVSHDVEFMKVWAQRKEALAAGTAGAVGERQLEELNQRKLDKGITNLWDYAILVMREGAQQADKGKKIKLGEFAQRLAPDLPDVYFYTGNAQLEQNRWKLSSVLEGNLSGVKASLRNIPMAIGQGLNALYGIGLGVLLAIFVFYLMVFFKRLPIYLHALTEELRGETPRLIRGIGRITLLALPFLLQLNIVWCALAWCLILWRYLTKGEKGLVLLSFLFVVYLPPTGDALLQYMAGPRAQAVFDIYETTYGERRPQAVERLERWVKDHPEDRDALSAVALAAKREGDYPRAKQYYQQLLKVNPSDPQGISNFGNLSLAMGDPVTASAMYQKAIELAPNNGAYYFNLSKALSLRSMVILQDADQTFQKAKELSPGVIAAHMEIDSPHPNRNVIDMTVPLDDLRRRLTAGFWRETGLSYFIVDAWLRNLSPRLPIVVPVLFVVAVIGLAIVREGREEWWRCSQCGMISTQPVGKREGRKGICVRCFRIIKGKEMDKGLKGGKLRDTKIFQIRMGVYDKLFPFFIPGVGHIWKGYNVWGLFYLCLFFVALGIVSFGRDIIPLPMPLPMVGVPGGVPFIGAFLVVLYVVAVWGSYKKEGREITKPSFSLEGIRR
jgi:tetratricopeptide (TPR) repeat protein